MLRYVLIKLLKTLKGISKDTKVMNYLLSKRTVLYGNTFANGVLITKENEISFNKKVLLRDRKRRTARCVSCPWHVLFGGVWRGGWTLPVLVLAGGGMGWGERAWEDVLLF